MKILSHEVKNAAYFFLIKHRSLREDYLVVCPLYCIHTNGIDLQRATFNTTGCLYYTQAHVLVVVANTQGRALRAESWRRVPCEQPLHMGQSILRPREVPLWAAVQDCLVRLCAPWSKGNRVNIPNLKAELAASRQSELRSYGAPRCWLEPGEELSFLCKGAGLPETDWIGERCVWSSVRCLAGPWKSGERV